MTADSVPQPYSLIVGNGRSGTNWLLSMLSASPFTHCRNEPQDIAQSPFHQLPTRLQMLHAPNLMPQKWDDFATWTATHMGERDHRITAPKTYLHPLSQRLGVAYWPVRPQIRNALKLLWADFQQGEWTLPWWIGDPHKLKAAYAIFKINDIRAWYVHWLLKHRPQRPIIHIARHPGGQLNSAINRFFAHLDPPQQEQERLLYTGILNTVVQFEPHWANVFGNPDEMHLIEAVAWFWRYNNEEIYKAGHQCSNYMFLTYEQLTQSPLQYARQVYNFCNLPWSNEIEHIIRNGLSLSMWGQLSQSPHQIAKTWKNNLDPNYQTLANRVLENSILNQYWAHESQ